LAPDCVQEFVNSTRLARIR